MSDIEQFLWSEKYRPHTVADTILPEGLKTTFQSFVAQKNIPNLLLTGSAGVGKTTLAKAMIEEIGANFHVVNGSLNGNIDTLRNEIMDFSSSMTMNGLRKYVILDEADYLNPNSFQPALRNFMEEFAKITGFILTANYPSRIIEPLHSRCSVIDFKINKTDFKDVAKQLFFRLQSILNTENITFEKAVLVEVIKQYFPDMRRILNELQTYGTATGKIDAGILTNFTNERLLSLIEHMKSRSFSSLRTWVTDNSDLDSSVLFRRLYDMASSLISPESIPVLVMILAKYQYQSAFVADQEINTAACLAEIMVEVTWK